MSIQKIKGPIKILVLVLLLACVQALNGQSMCAPDYKSGFKAWSVRIADSFIDRYAYDAILTDTSVFKGRWDYEQGLLLEALRRMWERTGNEKYYNYIKSNIGLFVNEQGDIKTYKLADYNLDNINTGRALLFLYERTGEKKYFTAATTLRKQLTDQPRTASGGFWHKKIYPEQMWLDGLYMAEPFYALYSKTFGEDNWKDIILQFRLIWENTLDEKTGLLYHAWNEDKKQKWADPLTGRSPHFWSRAIGWYCMAIVDVLDYMPREDDRRQILISYLRQISEALLKVKDTRTNLWYQLTALPEVKGNYLEASGSCMFAYTFAKGAAKGYLDKSYMDEALKIFEGVISNLTRQTECGKIDLLNTCRGAGLGGNPYRDGSVEYYLSEPRRVNDLKGVGPFILTALELEKAGVLDTAAAALVGLDYYFNHEMKNPAGTAPYQYHYTWEDTLDSGFSQFGNIINSLGARICAVKDKPTSKLLAPLRVYIIVDPDTPKESANPNVIDDESIETIVNWVKDGGALVLLNNDKRNGEFTYINKLAARFGLRFDENTRNNVTDHKYEMAAFTKLPDHPLFRGISKIYMKEICTLSIEKPAEAVLQDNGDIILASSRLGKGVVFAAGDPWFYNEYMDTRRLGSDYQNSLTAANLILWLLSTAGH